MTAKAPNRGRRRRMRILCLVLMLLCVAAFFVWHTMTQSGWKVLATMPTGYGYIWEVNLSPDGSIVGLRGGYDVLGSSPATKAPGVELWQFPGRRLLWEYRNRTQYTTYGPSENDALEFSPDGRYFAFVTGGRGRELAETRDFEIYDLTTRELQATCQIPGGAHLPEYICFSPDGNRLAGMGQQLDETGWELEHVGRIWDTATGEELVVFDTEQVTSVGYSPDGRWLLIGTVDINAKRDRSEIAVYDASDPLAGAKTTLSTRGAARRLAFSADGKTLVAALHDPYKPLWFLTLWDTDPWSERRDLIIPGFRITECALSPDGAYLAAPGLRFTNKSAWWTKLPFVDWALAKWSAKQRDTVGEVHVFDAETLEPVTVLDPRCASPQEIAFSQDGRILVTSGDNTVVLWEVPPRRLGKRIEQDVS